MPRAISASLNAHDAMLLDAEAPAVAAALASAPTPIELSVHEDLAAIEHDWRAFEATADCTVFQTFTWLSTWQRHVGARNDVRPAIVVGRRANGAILFILPLATRPLRLARELVFLGSELCDYNAPLLAPEFASTVPADRFAALWRSIRTTLGRSPRLHFDLIRLEKMPASNGRQPNPMLSLGVTLNPSGAYATPLAETWDAFYAAKRSAATRSSDRRKRKKLSEHGALAYVEPRNEADILATLDTLVAQKSRAFARMGVSNIFARPGYLDFYRALFTDAAARPLTHLSRLDCGDTSLAVNLGLTFRDSYYHLQASHDDGELSRFGPGAAHLHDLMRGAIEHGCTTYDFTIGDEPYKRDWCDGVIPLYDHLSSATLRGALLLAPMAAKTRLKRVIKQTPALWEAFRRVRSLAGRLTARG
jgi:CelD/BcsL family acetyltransferase involved in cellulose biosynthesis